MRFCDSAHQALVGAQGWGYAENPSRQWSLYLAGTVELTINCWAYNQLWELEPTAGTRLNYGNCNQLRELQLAA